MEVWNTSSSHLPWEKLEEFTSDIYISFLKYFKGNLPIIKTYLSVWYPFSYAEVLLYWEELEKGDAHYSVFLSDTDTIYPPKFGLCFNENIRWNSKLRSKWEYGFDNKFIGHVEGTGGANVEFDEKDYLDTIIPLNLNKELEIRNDCILNHWSSVIAPYEDFESENNFVEPNFIDISHINRQLDFLDLSSLQEIIKNEKLTFLTNKSIWEHTMSRMIDRDFCAEIFFELRNQSADKSS